VHIPATQIKAKASELLQLANKPENDRVEERLVQMCGFAPPCWIEKQESTVKVLDETETQALLDGVMAAGDREDAAQLLKALMWIEMGDSLDFASPEVAAPFYARARELDVNLFTPL
jgi:hypothetical protein